MVDLVMDNGRDKSRPYEIVLQTTEKITRDCSL